MSTSAVRRAPRKPRKKTAAVTNESAIEVPIPDVEHIVTEDDTPVDNLYSSKQQKLLTETLTSSWDGGGKPFIAAANVGLFNMPAAAAIVPDVVLALGVKPLGSPRHKCNRAYFFWMIGKPPDAAFEIVSNTEGGELTEKVEKYAFLRVPYYIVWDPGDFLKINKLRIHTLHEMRYVPTDETFLPGIGLGLKVWKGGFDDWDDVEWLRWCDRDGNLLRTGAEQRLRADQEKQRADEQQRLAEQQRQRAERLAAKLKALGVDSNGE